MMELKVMSSLTLTKMTAPDGIALFYSSLRKKSSRNITHSNTTGIYTPRLKTQHADTSPGEMTADLPIARRWLYSSTALR